ncbi:MAG: hypothetical protein AUH11_20205 [Acidobacteria bacterium 13_2_20CM_57_17]|nr:MAG: hypothetical protein AUH11_20205 [Acidobacteria bacterium 13_2_20CM_57_17]OLB91059.1 MAG: hypothetical protein AUI02_10290 [Acidobacteria bacterium 13_2_20CM_2_57_12]
MPGIVGLVTKRNREWAEPQLLRMVEAIRHEPFYRKGIWIDESMGVYVGWTVREKSFSDRMPLSNEEQSIFLVFSGEEYSEPGIARQLKERGHSVEPNGSSYLVHLYEEDQRFPLALNGMFHGLVTDSTRETATLFNDRFGMHPVCYHQSNDAFYFAAEAKAILAVRPELRTPDPQGLGEFVACSCVLGGRTIFNKIHVLPGGSVWVFRNGAIERKDTYFKIKEWEEQPLLDPSSYYAELCQVLSRNLPRYFNDHEPIGISLTGGLDTRVIMAWRKPEPHSLRSYTFGGGLRESQDVKVARKIAGVCQQSHQVITAGADFLARFPHYAERSIYLTEGGVDLCRSSDLYLSEKARGIAPTKIVGTYGSEIIRHGVMFKPQEPLQGLYRPEFLSYVHQAKNVYWSLREEHPVTFVAFRQSPWYHQGILALERSQLTVRSPYLDNDFVRTAFRAPNNNGASNEDIRLRLIRDGNPALAQIRTDRGFGGNSGRISRAVSRGLLEFTFKAEYAYDYGMPQWLARVDHLFSPLHLERLFLGRHKFYHFRVWYRDALSKYVRDMLLDPRTLSRPFLNPKRVEAVVNGHIKGGLNYTTEIHKLLSLELLHRLFFDHR